MRGSRRRPRSEAARRSWRGGDVKMGLESLLREGEREWEGVGRRREVAVDTVQFVAGLGDPRYAEMAPVFGQPVSRGGVRVGKTAKFGKGTGEKERRFLPIPGESREKVELTFCAIEAAGTFTPTVADSERLNSPGFRYRPGSDRFARPGEKDGVDAGPGAYPGARIHSFGPQPLSTKRYTGASSFGDSTAPRFSESRGIVSPGPGAYVLSSAGSSRVPSFGVGERPGVVRKADVSLEATLRGPTFLGTSMFGRSGKGFSLGSRSAWEPELAKLDISRRGKRGGSGDGAMGKGSMRRRRRRGRRGKLNVEEEVEARMRELQTRPSTRSTREEAQLAAFAVAAQKRAEEERREWEQEREWRKQRERGERLGGKVVKKKVKKKKMVTKIKRSVKTPMRRKRSEKVERKEEEGRREEGGGGQKKGMQRMPSVEEMSAALDDLAGAPTLRHSASLPPRPSTTAVSTRRRAKVELRKSTPKRQQHSTRTRPSTSSTRHRPTTTSTSTRPSTSSSASSGGLGLDDPLEKPILVFDPMKNGFIAAGTRREAGILSGELEERLKEERRKVADMIHGQKTEKDRRRAKAKMRDLERIATIHRHRMDEADRIAAREPVFNT